MNMRVLLVDDERIIREKIAGKMDWPSLRLDFAGSAENGLEALEMLRRDYADILITDIHMPLMNGIQLAEEARRLYPHIKIVFLSGYEEFRFAKRAMELSVMKYVLKPFTKRELEEAILQARDEAEAMRQEERRLQAAMSILETSFPLLRERYLNLWVSGRMAAGDVPAKLQMLQLPLDGERYCVLIIEPDQPEESLFGGKMEPAVGKGLLSVLIEREVERYVSDSSKGVSFHSEHDQIVVILQHAEEHAADETVFDSIDQLRQRILEACRVTVSIGVGGVKSGYAGVPESYKEAREAIEYRFLIGRNAVIPVDLIHLHPSQVWSGFPDEYPDRIIAAIRSGAVAELKQSLNAFFERLRQARGLSITDMRLYVTECTARIITQSLQTALRLKDMYGKDYNPYEAIAQYKTMDEAEQGLMTLLSDISRYILDSRGGRKNKLIEIAAAFIHEHYQMENISINVLSAELQVHPTYFSRLFRQETGSTFTEYLMKVRMEKAKEYLSGTALRVSEVAFAVGVKDPFYFSTLFKKHTGMNPTEFREQV
ncbi:MAG: two component transcriptional regulator, AraC family [Paenibacillaceae bacterium]|jgi:two-component system response regulator YesN|nr:two component transcriptional regulator, AraC family [Paenibacillaceae bacterium]